MSWGIAETASKLEKLKSESADYLNGLNSCGEIDYSTYSHAFDFYAELIEKAYKFGKDTNVPSNVPDTNVGDTISRQAAIKALNTEIIKRRLLDDVNDGMLDEFDTEDILRKLPPAQQERPKGYMKIKVISAVDGEDLFCENCDAYCLSPSYNFCPKCGMKFIGVRGEQDG